VADTDPEKLLTIGEFARRSQLTPKALRIYDRIGLLRPTASDPASGYRRYYVAQIRAGQLIGLLRGAGLSLAEIGLVLGDATQDTEAAVDRLDRLLLDLDRRHTDRRLLIRHVQTTLRQGADPMFPIQTRHVPARRVMSIQRRLHAHETDGFVREAKAAFREHLDGVGPTGPFTLIFHGVVSDDSDGPLEAVLGCPQTVQASDTVGIRTEPEHDEAYTTITKAQWAYPAILGAYDAVASSPEVKSRTGSRLSCREVYLAEPGDVEEGELICDVAFPLGDR
jgi:DNA-binding transcriptional MerR regulator